MLRLNSISISTSYSFKNVPAQTVFPSPLLPLSEMFRFKLYFHLSTSTSLRHVVIQTLFPSLHFYFSQACCGSNYISISPLLPLSLGFSLDFNNLCSSVLPTCRNYYLPEFPHFAHSLPSILLRNPKSAEKLDVCTKFNVNISPKIAP
jgi:hypothetical protein